MFEWVLPVLLPLFQESGAIPSPRRATEHLLRSLYESGEVHEVAANKRGLGPIGMEAPGNEPDRIVRDRPLIRNVKELDERRIRNGRTRSLPWTGSYWPMYLGLTAARYADPGFPHSRNWSVNDAYVRSNPVPANGTVPSRLLSPTEKYDLLVGDTGWSLTRWAWKQGRRYQREEGGVDAWMGLCHGWAAAARSSTLPRRDGITLTGRLGHRIHFYPGDVRALLTTAWANTPTETRFVGTRCYTENPDDNDESCRDVDPGAWHLVMTHQIGMDRSGLIMDAVRDDEVWNYPISEYRFRYFHPVTWKESPKALEAAVASGDFQNDPFRRFRSPDAEFIVGVRMDVSYVIPSSYRTGVKPVTPVRTRSYVYDLELNSEWEIIGGEWYQRDHPDFIWTHDDSALPVAESESPTDVRPDSLRGQPQFRVLRRLVE